MTSLALVELLQLIETAGVQIWLDGGWGVDALLGVQTRPHKDVDIIVRLSDLQRVGELLHTRGFAIRPGGTASNFVLVDRSGLEIDIHAITFDSNGNGVYRMANGPDWIYPAAGYDGRGTVDANAVRGIAPDAEVLGHADGSAPTTKAIEDMERLRVRFGVELPPHLGRAALSGCGVRCLRSA